MHAARKLTEPKPTAKAHFPNPRKLSDRNEELEQSKRPPLLSRAGPRRVPGEKLGPGSQMARTLGPSVVAHGRSKAPSVSAVMNTKMKKPELRGGGQLAQAGRFLLASRDQRTGITTSDWKGEGNARSEKLTGTLPRRVV